MSAISRLEDADYDGHSLNVLVRVMAALKHRLDWRVVPLNRGRFKIPTGDLFRTTPG